MTTEEHRVDVEAEPNGRRPRPRPRQARIKPNAILERLLEDGWRFATSGDALFTYVDGIYVPGTKALRRHLSERLGSQWEMTRVNSVIQLAKDISDDLWLMPSTTHINLKSGLYNRETGQLDPHTPEYLSPVQLPITYDPTAECPKLDQFLEDVCPKNSGPLAYEILGYLATPDTWLKRAFFLQGPKHSGKSTFCELIGLFLGHQNVTAHTLQHLTSNRFGLATLYGKLANVFPDLPPTRVEDSSIFKMITGNDHLVSAERKYESPFQFWMHCRLLFSANEFPQSADQSETYLGRWLVLLFPNQFDLNPTFLETIVTPEELSGLFNKAMAAYQGVIERKNFTDNEATQEGSERMREAIVPVIAFLSECCNTSSEKFRTDRVDLYHAFCGWCSQTGRRRPTNRKFYEQLRQHFHLGKEVPYDGRPVWTHLTLSDEGSQALEYFKRSEKL